MNAVWWLAFLIFAVTLTIFVHWAGTAKCPDCGRRRDIGETSCLACAIRRRHDLKFCPLCHREVDSVSRVVRAGGQAWHYRCLADVEGEAVDRVVVLPDVEEADRG